MNVYFAGSIRGGRDDASLYLELISHTRTYGDVLTEHVGDLALERDGEVQLSDAAIFARDLDWLDIADVIVAEVSTPSLGVGYEIAIAESMGKPVLCLVKSAMADSLSAMISGNPHVKLAEYETVDEAKARIDEFIRAGDDPLSPLQFPNTLR